MKMNILRTPIALLTMLAMSLLAPIQAIAQDDEPMFFQVRSVQVKPGRNNDFADLQKEFTAALKAAERPARDIYQEIRGDLGVFHTVTRPAALSTYDTPFDPPMSDDEWADWIARYQDATESSTLMILRRYPDLAITSDDDMAPNLLYLRYRTVASGKSAEYADWVKNQLVLHLKMGGLKSRSQSRIVMGGNNNTWVSATPLANWAEMEAEGPLAHMGADGAAALLAPGNALVVESENRILRYRADLSR